MSKVDAPFQSAGGLTKRWRALDPAWRFALTTFLIARVALTAWSLVVLALFPVVVQNLDLFGAPTLAVFDFASGERFVFSRAVDDQVLTFRAGERGTLIDLQTGSVWDLRAGRAVGGEYAGRAFDTSTFTVEDIFPYRGVAVETNPLLGAWQRFDTNWYLALAREGYAQVGSTVYFPLYPLLIRLANFILPNEMLAALVMSNLALVGALYFFYRLAEKIFGVWVARRATIFWLLFPTGFFLFAAYTESLFLFLSLGAILFAQRERWALAILFGVLAALTRLQGALLILPLAYVWWKQSADKKSFIAGIALLLIPVTTVAFLAFTNLSLLATYEGELHARFVLPWDDVGAALMLLINRAANFVDGFNLFVTALFGAMLYFVWQKLPREYFLYALAMYAAPLFRMTTTQPLVSMDRYALAIFPVFILWSQWGQNRWVTRAIVYLSIPLALYFSAQFVLWGWVG